MRAKDEVALEAQADQCARHRIAAIGWQARLGDIDDQINQSCLPPGLNQDNGQPTFGGQEETAALGIETNVIAFEELRSQDVFFGEPGHHVSRVSDDHAVQTNHDCRYSRYLS
jgi:hypothetical protein